MRRWPVLAPASHAPVAHVSLAAPKPVGILTVLQYVPVPVRRPPSLTSARYAAEKGHPRVAFLVDTLLR